MFRAVNWNRVWDTVGASVPGPERGKGAEFARDEEAGDAGAGAEGQSVRLLIFINCGSGNPPGQSARTTLLLQGRSVRDGGWSIRELLCVALGRAEAAEKATRDTVVQLREVEERLAASERNVDAWREHSERGGRGYSGAEGSPPHSTGNDARYTDPYAQPERKRTRYSNGGRELEYDPYAQRQWDVDRQAALVPPPYKSYEQGSYKYPRTASDRYHR